jgi:hypothetical protein
MGLDKTEARVEAEGVEDVVPVCDMCDDPAEFGLEVEASTSVTPLACVQHLGKVARAALDTWGEHGVICIMNATEA